MCYESAALSSRHPIMLPPSLHYSNLCEVLHSLQSGFLVDCSMCSCFVLSFDFKLDHSVIWKGTNTKIQNWHKNRTCSEDSCFPLIIVHYLESKHSVEYCIHQSPNSFVELSVNLHCGYRDKHNAVGTKIAFHTTKAIAFYVHGKPVNSKLLSWL